MFRLLNAGEKVKEGDEVFSFCSWQPIAKKGFHTTVNSWDFPIRRKISEDSGTQPTASNTTKAKIELLLKGAVGRYRENKPELGEQCINNALSLLSAIC